MFGKQLNHHLHHHNKQTLSIAMFIKHSFMFHFWVITILCFITSHSGENVIFSDLAVIEVLTFSFLQSIKCRLKQLHVLPLFDSLSRNSMNSICLINSFIFHSLTLWAVHWNMNFRSFPLKFTMDRFFLFFSVSNFYAIEPMVFVFPWNEQQNRSNHNQSQLNTWTNQATNFNSIQ